MARLASLLDVSGVQFAAERAVRVIAILVVAWVLARVAVRIIGSLRRHVPPHAQAAPRIATAVQVLKNASTVVIFIVAGTLILGELGISIAPILATAGVAGIAIGFGAQSLIRDYFTGFFLLIEDQIREGDYVEVAGRAGFVEEMTLRHARLRDLDGNLFFVPNGEVKVVVNRSRGVALAVADALVKSAQSLEPALAAMREAGATLARDPDFTAWVLGPLEIFGVERWEPWGLALRCRLPVAARAQWRVRSELLKRIKSEFEARGIQTP